MTFMSIRSVGLALLMAFAAAGALAAGKTLTVTEKSICRIGHRGLATIKDFNGWQDWHPAIGSTENHQREREHQRYGAGHEHQGWRAN